VEKTCSGAVHISPIANGSEQSAPAAVNRLMRASSDAVGATRDCTSV